MTATRTDTRTRPQTAPTDAASELVLPRDFDAEQAVLGSMLLEPGAAARAFAIVGPDDFYWEDHQAIARAIATCAGRGEPVDLVTVSGELRRSELLEKVGGGTYLAALIGEVPTAAHVVRYATAVAECAVLRATIEDCRRVALAAYARPADVGALLREQDELAARVRERVGAPAAPTLRTFANLDLLPPPSWAWPGWLANGHLSLLFGPPGAGKSYLALALCGSIVAGRPWPDGAPAQPPATALLLDYEQTLRETLDRAKGMGLPLHMLLTQPEDALPYLTRADSPQTIAQWIADSGARLLVVDSLRDALPGVDENDAAATAQALHGLKLVAHEADVAVLLLHHCRKQQAGGDGQARWELTQDDLRGSSAIAGAVRTILAIDRPDAARQTRRLKLVKSNFGPTPEPLGFDLGEAGLEWTAAPFAGRNMPQQAAALEALQITLQRGPLCYSELRDVLREQYSISEATMKRSLKAIAVKGADGRWGLASQGLQVA